MQEENFRQQLGLVSVLHDVSNAFKGASIILKQIINGAYGESIEEVRPLLMVLLETNNRGMKFLEAKTSFSEISPASVGQFDMLDLLQKLYSQFQPVAEYYSLKLHYENQVSEKHGTQIRADIISIERMLCNLLTNAIKYTEDGDIFLRAFNQEDDLVIEIEDTGCGIAAQQLSNIFIPFWRSPDNKIVNQSGKGLGLYIALSVAHAYGLDIKVNSTVGQGSKFTIIFPYGDNGIYGFDGRIMPKSQRIEDALSI